MTAAQLEATLRGHTLLKSLSLEATRSWTCDLELELARDESIGVRVLFRDVSELSLREVGGGLIQVLLLRIEDVRDRQLERIRYRVSELERGTISFSCRAFELRDESEPR